jgi:hypothetical protein
MQLNITHESMMALTAQMPMKEIIINGEVYLQRYFAHQLADGTQVWYHRFLRNDSEPHLHSHPWSATSTILVGKYEEEFLDEDEGMEGSLIYEAGQKNTIMEETIHRIVRVRKNTWTMMIVSPSRKPTWHFIEADGTKTEMQTSPFEWSKDFKARDAA